MPFPNNHHRIPFLSEKIHILVAITIPGQLDTIESPREFVASRRPSCIYRDGNGATNLVPRLFYVHAISPRKLIEVSSSFPSHDAQMHRPPIHPPRKLSPFSIEKLESTRHVGRFIRFLSQLKRAREREMRGHWPKVLAAISARPPALRQRINLAVGKRICARSRPASIAKGFPRSMIYLEDRACRVDVPRLRQLPWFRLATTGGWY